MTEQQKGRRALEVGPTGRTAAANLALWRNRRGLTTRQLSGALERAGRPIPASGITRMEKGERVITTDDLVALAAVLEVSTVALLLPAEPPQGQTDDSRRDWVEVTGFPAGMPWETAWRWMHGEFPPANVPVREVRKFREENRPYEDENPAREVEQLLRSRIDGSWHLEADHDEDGSTWSRLTRRSGGDG